MFHATCRNSFAFLLLAVLVLCGCQDLRNAASDSARLDADLHAAMTRGDWQGIYDNADPGFRENVPSEKSEILFTTLVKKLGAPVSSKETSWNRNADTAGTFLRVQCDTKFAQNASGVETIVWRRSGKWLPAVRVPHQLG